MWVETLEMDHITCCHSLTHSVGEKCAVKFTGSVVIF